MSIAIDKFLRAIFLRPLGAHGLVFLLHLDIPLGGAKTIQCSQLRYYQSVRTKPSLYVLLRKSKEVGVPDSFLQREVDPSSVSGLGILQVFFTIRVSVRVCVSVRVRVSSMLAPMPASMPSPPRQLPRPRKCSCQCPRSVAKSVSSPTHRDRPNQRFQQSPCRRPSWRALLSTLISVRVGALVGAPS